MGKPNINAYIERIQSSGGGSLNSSPVSQSMAPSTAQRLVYERAIAAHHAGGNDWLLTKTMEVTQAKYSGLIGIVFNGTSYFLSCILLNLWLQIGVWLVYSEHVEDNIASIFSLTMMFISILIYYGFEIFYLSKYLVYNFATHIVFIINFSSMTTRKLFTNDDCQFVTILEIVILAVVVVAFILKIGVSIRWHNRFKRAKEEMAVGNNEQPGQMDEYERI